MKRVLACFTFVPSEALSFNYKRPKLSIVGKHDFLKGKVAWVTRSLSRSMRAGGGHHQHQQLTKMHCLKPSRYLWATLLVVGEMAARFLQLLFCVMSFALSVAKFKIASQLGQTGEKIGSLSLPWSKFYYICWSQLCEFSCCSRICCYSSVCSPFSLTIYCCLPYELTLKFNRQIVF